MPDRRRTRAILTLAALGAGISLWAAPDVSPAREEGAAPPGQASDDVWVLEEFDWGDSRELVDESVRYALPFTCNAIGGRCALPVVTVDGEDLLVKFGFYEGLYQIRILTPDLTRAKADAHAERVWKLLVDYVTRHQGAPAEAEASLPDLDALAPHEMRVTHRWTLDDQTIHVGVGRRGAAFFVVARFFDPEREARRLGRPRADDAASAAGSGAGGAGGKGGAGAP